jgi:polysaccharide deacetylase 2 family uncharacterized protein YibQ
MPKKPSRRTTKPKAKPKARSKTKARRKKKPSLRANLIKAAGGLAVLILLVVGAGLLLNHLLKPPPRVVKAPAKKVHAPTPPATATKAPTRHRAEKKEKKAAIKPPTPGKEPRKQASVKALKPPVYEIYPEEEIPPPPARPSKPPPKGLPEVAIIIDDVGYDRAIAEKFIRLDDRLTLSIFPYAPYRRSIAKTARQHGLGLMLHLPMEPNEYPRVNPGPGKLLTSMTPDQLIAQLNKDLDQVPGIQGVNNHMGSKMTARSSQMNQIFTILKKRGYFFIDSRTTKETVCRSSARLLKVPFAQRKVFLDHTLDPETIRRQIRQLVRYARKYGVAVGIGHPHAVTYRILKEELPRLRKKVRLVRASEIVHVIS